MKSVGHTTFCLVLHGVCRWSLVVCKASSPSKYSLVVGAPAVATFRGTEFAEVGSRGQLHFVLAPVRFLYARLAPRTCCVDEKMQHVGENVRRKY